MEFRTNNFNHSLPKKQLSSLCYCSARLYVYVCVCTQGMSEHCTREHDYESTGIVYRYEFRGHSYFLYAFISSSSSAHFAKAWRSHYLFYVCVCLTVYQCLCATVSVHRFRGLTTNFWRYRWKWGTQLLSRDSWTFGAQTSPIAVIIAYYRKDDTQANDKQRTNERKRKKNNIEIITKYETNLKWLLQFCAEELLLMCANANVEQHHRHHHHLHCHRSSQRQMRQIIFVCRTRSRTAA